MHLLHTLVLRYDIAGESEDDNLAIHKYGAYLTQSSEADTFEKVYHPSTTTPLSGIYRCMTCGREAVSTADHPLQAQNHHQHAQRQGAILWRLIVFADHRPKSN